jgi:RodZ C-terminal domain
MVMTRSDRDDRRTRDGFIMECAVCGAYLRWVHLEASANGSKCSFCGATVVPTRPDGFRDVDERLIEIEDLGLIGERPEDPPSLLEPIRQTPRIPAWVFVTLSILAIVGMGAWRLMNSPSTPAAPISANDTGPSVNSQVPPASKGEHEPPVATRITAIVRLDNPTWIEVTRDGRATTSETYAPQRLVFHAHHQMFMWLGHGTGVTLTVNGDRVHVDDNSASMMMTLHRNGRVTIATA